VVEPGEPLGKYHNETEQEAYLVLSGEGTLLVEGEERPMMAWDFFHCPPKVSHMFIASGNGPCAILAVGSRSDDNVLEYPATELAEKYGVSAAKTTNSPEEAYADWPSEMTPGKLDWPPPSGE
jgi:uncharacterized cupin superfamily protein